MKIKKIVIYVQLDNGNIHQVLDNIENKMMSLDVLRILNDNKLPLNERKESFEFEI